MKSIPLRLIPAFVVIFAFTAIFPASSANAQSETNARHSRFALAIYSESRSGYEPPPVQIAGLRGGKPGGHEKLRIEVSALKNQTAKQVTAIMFKAFIFDHKDLNEALETVETPLVQVDMPGLKLLTLRTSEIPILNPEDVPALAL